MSILKTTALAVVAVFALAGCSIDISSDSGGASGSPWKASQFPAPAMSESDAVVPAGTYDFVFTTNLTTDPAAPADTINATGRIQFGPKECAFNAIVKETRAGQASEFEVLKPKDGGVHAYDAAAKQWVNDPTNLSFMPMMTFAGAGVEPRADVYASFCAINSIALIAKTPTDGFIEPGTFIVDSETLARYIQANADWYVDEILKAARLAGDSREEAVPLLQKHFNLDKIDAAARAEEMFTITKDAATGIITVKAGTSRSMDFGTYVLTPTAEKVVAEIPVDKVPATWTQAIATGIEIAGSVKNFLAGIFPENPVLKAPEEPAPSKEAPAPVETEPAPEVSPSAEG